MTLGLLPCTCPPDTEPYEYAMGCPSCTAASKRARDAGQAFRVDRRSTLAAEIRAVLAKATPGPWEADLRFQAIRDAQEADWIADVAWEDDLKLICLLRNNAEALLEALAPSGVRPTENGPCEHGKTVCACYGGEE